MPSNGEHIWSGHSCPIETDWVYSKSTRIMFFVQKIFSRKKKLPRPGPLLVDMGTKPVEKLPVMQDPAVLLALQSLQQQLKRHPGREVQSLHQQLKRHQYWNHRLR